MRPVELIPDQAECPLHFEVPHFLMQLPVDQLMECFG